MCPSCPVTDRGKCNIIHKCDKTPTNVLLNLNFLTRINLHPKIKDQSYLKKNSPSVTPKLFANSPHVKKKNNNNKTLKQLNQADCFCLSNYTKLEGETEQRPRTLSNRKRFSVVLHYKQRLMEGDYLFSSCLQDTNK